MNIIAFLGAFFLMEFVAWFTHKYVMHGPLWRLHRDHHHKGEDGFFEKNDTFFLLFAIPGILLLLFGSMHGFDYRFWAGAGITAYGAAYFLVHDVFIHQRFRLLRRTNHVYFRAIRKAHKVHHKKLHRKNGECFGMLLVPFRYLREARTEKGG